MSFGKRTTADEVLDGLDLGGRVVLVTGATAGIGYETARALAAAGARVYVGARSIEKGTQTCGRIRERHPSADVRPFVADLGDLASVRQAAEDLDEAALHAVIANAGVYGGGYVETAQGLERTVGVCHFGHAALIDALTERLVAGAPSRVVVVASGSHRGVKALDLSQVPPTREQHTDLRAYDLAKLCNVLFASALDVRLRDRGVRANSLHPGTMMATDISRSSVAARVLITLFRPFSKGLEQGAATSVWAAVHPDLDDVGGAYLVDCQVGRASDLGRDPEAAERLWAHTEAVLARLR